MWWKQNFKFVFSLLRVTFIALSFEMNAQSPFSVEQKGLCMKRLFASGPDQREKTLLTTRWSGYDNPLLSRGTIDCQQLRPHQYAASCFAKRNIFLWRTETGDLACHRSRDSSLFWDIRKILLRPNTTMNPFWTSESKIPFCDWINGH